MPPAGSVAGRVPAFTVKALLELVNCATCTEEVLEFVIDTVWNTGVPIVTSPKSIVAGVICNVIAVELVEENGFESEPQPERARLSAIATRLKAMALPAIPRNLFFVWVARDRLGVIFSLIPKIKILRNLHIDHHLRQRELVSRCG